MRELFDLEITRTGEDRRGCFAVVEAPGFDGQLCDVYGEDEDDAAENAKALVEQVNAYAEQQAEVERLRGEKSENFKAFSEVSDAYKIKSKRADTLEAEIERLRAALRAAREFIGQTPTTSIDFRDISDIFAQIDNALEGEECAN